MYRDISKLLAAARTVLTVVGIPGTIDAGSETDRKIAFAKLDRAVTALDHVDLTSDPDPDCQEQTLGDDADDILALGREADRLQLRLNELTALYKTTTDQLEAVRREAHSAGYEAGLLDGPPHGYKG